MTMTPKPTILRVDASGRYEDSQTRRLTDKLVAQLSSGDDSHVMTRDVATGVEFVGAEWINANFTPEEERTEAQVQRLAGSDALVDELFRSDVIVIGSPIYNFGVPAALKAWVDQVARARKTFRYTENGRVGLLEGKKAYIVVTSGGTAVGSDIDFATGYLKHILGFIGIHDVTVFAADQLMKHGEQKITAVEQEIEAHFASKSANAA
ncbi:MAG: NAD(P)H-dependent oxidoreductase [Pseudomonadota bacterium]